jgi:hypothetical protein
MMYHIDCGCCGARMLITEELLGGWVACCSCSAVFSVGLPADAPEPPPGPAGQPSAPQQDDEPPAWYCRLADGSVQGPMAYAALAGLAASGALLPTCKVFREGMRGWVAASSFPDLARGMEAAAAEHGGDLRGFAEGFAEGFADQMREEQAEQLFRDVVEGVGGFLSELFGEQ